MPLLVAGCATSADVQGVERQTAGINAGLREVKGNLDEINYSLQAENKRSKDTQASLASMQRDIEEVSMSARGLSDELSVIKKNQADLGSRMFSSAGGGGGKITDGSLDEIRHELTETNAKLDALKAVLLQRLAEIEQSMQAAKADEALAAKGGSTTATVPAGDPNQMYQSAYLDYTKGNYDLAVSGFREYLKAFPDAEFAGNAQYWVGESLYSLGKYDEAVTEFDKVIKGYPASSKVPGAMLKKGYCFDALKKSKDAKAAYGELINKYPASEAAKLAEERLKKK